MLSHLGLLVLLFGDASSLEQMNYYGCKRVDTASNINMLWCLGFEFTITAFRKVLRARKFLLAAIYVPVAGFRRGTALCGALSLWIDA
jgi:hypothetical protein